MAQINPFSTLLDDDTGDHDGLLSRVEATAAASKQLKVSQSPTLAVHPANFNGRSRVYNNTYRGGGPGSGLGWYPAPAIYNQGYMRYNDGGYYHNGGYHGQEIEYENGGYNGQGPEDFFDNGRNYNYNEGYVEEYGVRGGYGRGGGAYYHGGYRGGEDRRGEEEEYLDNECNQGYVEGGHVGGVGGYRGGRGGGGGYYRGENRGVYGNVVIRRWVERGRVASKEVDGAGKEQQEPVHEGGNISKHRGEVRQAEEEEYLDEGYYPNNEGYVEEFGTKGGHGRGGYRARGVYRNGVTRRWVERGQVASEEVDGAGKEQQEPVQEGGKLSEQASSKGNEKSTEVNTNVDTEEVVAEAGAGPVVKQGDPDEAKAIEQAEQAIPDETNTTTEKKKKKKKRKSKVESAPLQEPVEEDMSNKLTLDEYERIQQEKRKALDDMKTQERKVDKEQYEGLEKLGKFTNPKEEEVVFIKIQKSEEKKPKQKKVDDIEEKAKEQKKAPQVMTINELGFRAPARVRGRGYSTDRGGANFHATNDSGNKGQYSSGQGRGYYNSDRGYQGGFYNGSDSTQGDSAGHEGPNGGGYRRGYSNGRGSNGGAYRGQHYDRDASTHGDFAGRGASNGGGYRGGHSISRGYFNPGGASNERMGGGRSNDRRPRPPPSVEDLRQFPALQKAPEAMTAPEAAPKV